MKRVAFILAFLLTLSHVRSQTVVDIIVNSPDHTILEAAVLAAGLEGTLSGPGPFTVFAPTDAAFGALPAGTIEALLADPQGALTDILLYHVVGATALSTDLSDGQVIATLNGDDVTVTINGQGVFINNAQVIVADLVADNGVVHVIDAVLLPPPPVTVVDIIVNSPDHTILEAAVLAAGLEGTLSGEGPFTVFAPTDVAFGALPAGTIEALLADPQGALTDILLYHVVGATALSTDLSDGQVITTLNGDDVTVTINGQGVFINNAQVIVADLIADNGVVHVIDAVLLPLTSATAATEYTDGLVFPNPTSSAITIRLDASVPVMHNVQMIDVDGRIIDGWRMINNGETINIRDVPSGMYTLFFEINATPYFQRIVVQK